jgi:hypothetical protein
MFALKGEHYFASLVGRLADMIWGIVNPALKRWAIIGEWFQIGK